MQFVIIAIIFYSVLRMLWFKKIFSNFNKDSYEAPINADDNSRALKRGEIKILLIRAAASSSPDFTFFDYHKGCYIFQRNRLLDRCVVHETIHIIFSLQGGYFDCSIASRLNPKLIYDGQYNSGLINYHKNLISIKSGGKPIPLDESYYSHKGNLDTINKSIAQIFNDFQTTGLPIIDKKYEQFKTHPIIKLGLDFINRLEIDKLTLKQELELQLSQNESVYSRVQHSLYLDLKEKLQSIPNQSREDRQYIPKTAYELLEYYCSN